MLSLGKACAIAVTSPSMCFVSTGISAGRSVGIMLLYVGAIGVGNEIWTG